MKKVIQGFIALAAVMAIGMAAPSGALLAGPYGGVSYADCSVDHKSSHARGGHAEGKHPVCSHPDCSGKHGVAGTLKEAAKALQGTRPDLAEKVDAIAAAHK